MISGTNAAGQRVVTMDFQELMHLPVTGLDLRSTSVPVQELMVYAAWQAAGLGEFRNGTYSLGQSGNQWTITYIE